MAESKQSVRDFFTDPVERRKYYPYPEKAISTSTGEVYMKTEDLLSDPDVLEQIRDLRKFVADKKLIKKK